jgi:putative ABC transport system ATP-binding protein
VIQLNHISKIYFEGTENEVAANNDITLHIKKGELVAIIGQSGSGKSTLMNIIGALDKPTKGEYILDGIKVNEIADNDLSDIRNQKIGFVFQTFNLLAKINAQRNVELPALYAGLNKKDREAKSEELLELVGMKDRKGHMPNELSGGQKQRVAIARSLVNDPAIILADEPTGALDSKTTKMVLELFQEIHKKKGATIVIITHSSEVAAICDRVVTVVDGKVVSDKMNDHTKNTTGGWV